MRYQVDSEAVLATSSAARASIARLEADVAALHGQLGAAQGSWTGAAATAFQSAATEWYGTEQRVVENLSALTRALAHAAQTYSDIEHQNAQMFLH
ncbi:WXG100 family type VII secretion target [Diaminobutyricimonas sp. TR449]|uniref:WXG100 family type VII secretion target n=1 Tax=Diaminobutyricimonas sp. TR449 TaxID=2708076 RepID=UPI001421C29E|nr:WXG100 family type VII secretion target [Diaminobutyricimonas sp. TR449]